ncbi:MAG: translation initiation factor IF-3 [Ignavibacteriales bacterium]|nr:translation initiation factor IF-3 [Ignavibacteriales bacterium]MDP2036747.1 translation initiation factor IF-3 [Ignavibacteria bacterium]OGU67760.1 MAG: translation initiation factor IF-3 [Stygiobacter sp. GWC2_38_9]OGV06123.1 MAG: translation initiation factor IF-3 [Stygiobacter sp. RIFOXYB2_FULL_37_11]OGV11361.1 MAG: translation initiation factor IF-3 [Stygiobacter sp. RIFOXYA2_FULL_38_8]OGV16813.1 MAG: translation initiation factor IF-3 [Stygiobacter sp. RIFOXYC2_FULL_38_25]OGV23474.1 
MTQVKNRVNQEIRVAEVRLIGADGEQIGIVSIKEALKKAEEANLDLVEIAPQAVPPVCKVIDYGKFAYELQKKEKLQKKNQQVSVLKEIRLHPNTDTHDFDFKARHAANFVEEGDKVKVSVIFKGRELAYTEIGENLLKKFIERLSEVAKVEQEPKFEGRAMHAILAPSKGKKKK